MTTKLIKQTLFYFIIMESLMLWGRHLSCELSLMARSKKRWLYLQATLMVPYNSTEWKFLTLQQNS